MVRNENALTLRGIKIKLLSTQLKEVLDNKRLTPKKPQITLKVLLNLMMRFHYGSKILLIKNLLLYDSFPFQELACFLVH